MSVHMIYYKDGAKMMRPVLSREEYLGLRDSDLQRKMVSAIRKGDESLKSRLVQMNYSCLPNEDGTLKGSTRMSTSVGMDVDWTPSPLPLVGEEQTAARKEEWLKKVPELVMSKKDEIGLLMLERSATKGYHLVFRRRPTMSQEDNLRWASTLLGVDYDAGAKDITRVFFTTSASAEDLIYLDDEIFRTEQTLSNSPLQGEDGHGQTDSTPLLNREGSGESLLVATESSLLAFDLCARQAGLNAESMDVWGERNWHSNLMAVLSVGVAKLMTRQQLQAVVAQRLPNYSQTDDCRNLIEYFYEKYDANKGFMNASLREINAKVQEQKVDEPTIEDEDEDNGQSSMVNGQSSALPRLPIGLKESLIGVPESMHMPVLCAVLPIAAAYADQVEVEYCDGVRHRLGLMSIIRGEQASNKSICKTVVDVWKRQFDKEDALAREREDEWKERRKGRKANEKAPEDPKVLIRMVPVTVSCSTLLKRLKNAQGHCLYSFGEELDTLRKTNGAGSWSSKYDIYRMGFDHGEWGQDYNSDQAESGVVNVAYNWTMLGTYGAVRRCFKQDNIENGLSSRVLMAEMPDGAFARLTKFARRSEADEDRIQEAVTRLRSYSGFIDTPRLRKAIEKWVESKRVIAAKNIDYVMDTYRKRSAVIGFRCGVIHHLLRGEEREHKTSLNFAIAIAEYCLEQQMKAFGEALQSGFVSAKDECQRYGANHSIFDQLPPVFSMNDLRALKRGFCGEEAMRMIISRWKKDGWIEKVDNRHWKKVVTS